MPFIQLECENDRNVSCARKLQFDAESGGRVACFGDDHVSPLDHFLVPEVAETGAISEWLLSKLGITISQRILDLGRRLASQSIGNAFYQPDVFCKFVSGNMRKAACDIDLHVVH